MSSSHREKKPVMQIWDNIWHANSQQLKSMSPIFYLSCHSFLLSSLTHRLCQMCHKAFGGFGSPVWSDGEGQWWICGPVLVRWRRAGYPQDSVPAAKTVPIHRGQLWGNAEQNTKMVSWVWWCCLLFSDLPVCTGVIDSCTWLSFYVCFSMLWIFCPTSCSIMSPLFTLSC